MDTDPEELQFLGFFGICHEAHKLILSCRRLFTQITLSLILPLSCLYLAHIQITDLIFAKIDHNVDELNDVQKGSAAESNILSRLSSEWTAFLLFKSAYLLAVLVFALLSTSAVVYTVACIYTAKNVAFLKVITVVPKVWKRLMVTFLWSFVILFVYNMAAFFLIFLVLLLFSNPVGVPISIVLFIVYLAGLVYISVVWHIASVISVLEDMYGIAAMRKSKALIKGKVSIIAGIFVLFQLLFLAVEVLFGKVVVHGRRLGLGLGLRFGYGLMIEAALMAVILVALVVQTVVYFVCKSYHHESIDKSILADHLEVYFGEYVPLKEQDVQLEQFHV